jgi:hypothetical protein
VWNVQRWVKKNHLPIFVAAGAILLLALPTILTRSAKPIAAGWEDLVFCLDLVSFDGKKRLTLADGGIATIEDKTNSGTKAIAGT